MTKKFDTFVKNILKECGMDVSGVLGNNGSYDTSDPRNPVILGPMQRRNKRKRKKYK